MSEIVREMAREELVAENNKLRAENEELRVQIDELKYVIDHDRHVAENNRYEQELRYRDGVIYGMKYVLRCNGVSGGEVEHETD